MRRLQRRILVVVVALVVILRPTVNGFLLLPRLFAGSSSSTSFLPQPPKQQQQQQRTTTLLLKQQQQSSQLFSSPVNDDSKATTVSARYSNQGQRRRPPNDRFTTNTRQWSNNETQLSSYPTVNQQDVATIIKQQTKTFPNNKLVSDQRNNIALSSLEGATSSSSSAPPAALSASPELLQALKMLQVARTQQDIVRIGRLIESMHVAQTESRLIQERVIKATASAGLVALALDLLYHQLQQQQQQQHYLPTEATYLSVCLALRRLGRTQQLEQVLLELGRCVGKLQSTTTTSASTPPSVSVVALNILLAALCKSATITTSSTTADRKSNNNNNRNKKTLPLFEREVTRHGSLAQQQQQALDRAWQWLKDDYRLLHIQQPDATSFATVLNAAAANHNQTSVDLVWNEMKACGIQPDIYCYNARLRSIVKRASSRTAGSSETGTATDNEALQLLDQLLQDPNVEGGPDPYTIHWLLMPLVRSGRVGDLETHLNGLIRRYPPHVVSDAFSAFFVTLIQGGELATARALFDTYVQPAIVARHDNDNQDEIPLSVPPQVRHFNMLIDGYRQLAELFSIDESDLYTTSSAPTSSSASLFPSPNHIMSINARREGIQLYHMLLETELYPDSYTLTSVLGLCATSNEIAQVLSQAVRELEVPMTPAVIRATITAFGKVLDPASACWVTDEYAAMTLNNRAWNILLGALASGAKMDAARTQQPLDIFSSVAATLMPKANQCKLRLDKHSGLKSDRGDKISEGFDFQFRLSDHLNGLSCVEAAKVVLDLMANGSEPTNGKPATACPLPNSQSFCLAAAALQHGNNTGSELATDLFRKANMAGLATDGRFINAVLRCFGDDVDGALAAWKNEIRKACLQTPESRSTESSSSPPQRRPQPPQTTKNLLAAYHGLMFVCGRAFRPDIGVRLVYAMAKEGIEPNEVALKCYQSGKRLRQQLVGTSTDGSDMAYKFLVADQYESLLYVECTKYDTNDRRRFGEQRVRIIV